MPCFFFAGRALYFVDKAFLHRAAICMAFDGVAPKGRLVLMTRVS